MDHPLIVFQNASLGYGRKVILQDVSFEIFDGDYLGMVGPNGAGKTTILRAILGTLSPIKGEVRVIPKGSSPIRFGYVPQRDAIDSFLPYTAEEVVTMGRYKDIGVLRRPRTEDRRIVQESLEHVRVAEIRSRRFNDLSGGQKQRVLIARALAAKPDVLVLDEPTNGMDLSSRVSILDLITSLHSNDGLTVIMVSHLLDDVANHVRRIAIVEQEFFRVGTVQEVLTGDNLTAMYRMPVRVEHLGKSTVILAGGGHGTA